jgi:hypothetical protein
MLLSQRLNSTWKVDIPDRQIYLGSFTNAEIAQELQRLINALTDVSDASRLSLATVGSKATANGLSLEINAYLCVAPEGDEALVTDYEQLLVRLQQNPDDASIAGMLSVVNNFLFQNPVSIAQGLEEAYRSEPMPTRISYPSPIPLNSEQLLVTRALRDAECRRVVIEGPPGTGKSHTITALIFEALRDGRSILLVSDKKEALDVVEDKINQVLDSAKIDDTFQNPILRLGARENNFSKIFYEGNLVKIRARDSALAGRRATIKGEVARLEERIKKEAEAEVSTLVALRSAATASALEFEGSHADFLSRIDEDEISAGRGSDLIDLFDEADDLTGVLKELRSTCAPAALGTTSELHANLTAARDALLLVSSLVRSAEASPFVNDITGAKIGFLAELPARTLSLKKSVVGYLFAGKELDLLTLNFRQQFPNSPESKLQDLIASIPRDVDIFRRLGATQIPLGFLGLDPFDLIRSQASPKVMELIDRLSSCIEAYSRAFHTVPETAGRLGFTLNLDMLVETGLPFSRDTVAQYLIYRSTYSGLKTASEASRAGSYLGQRREIEKRLTLEMSSILDRSVLRFSEQHRGDAEEIRKILRGRKQIPRQLLPALVGAFPCIIIGIRELGSYIPFEPEMFDLVVIDEASQVSIAQALPAILRAKKTVVLGDPKQYSNVKASFASANLNAAAFANVSSVFADSMQEGDRDTQRRFHDKIQTFNIKTSVLEFVRYLSNYSVFLRKHFRGYNELIAYSNEMFYQQMLQVMKIRSRPVAEVIKFEQVSSSAGAPVDKAGNTNDEEAAFILQQLEMLKESGYNGTVGVITPFHDQQALLWSRVLESSNGQYYRKQLRLKIMTFDSAQGEERDIIFYSMVEKSGEDNLRFIFPKSLNAAEPDDEGNVRKQRLNVGLSRARETVHFIVSKPLTEFGGEIGNALRYFEQQLAQPDFATLIAKTDPKSKMEPKILQMISQTTFYRENRKRLEIFPQFPIGEMIRQLDPFAETPRWKVDFLIVLSEQNSSSQKVIVEYDGVESHFVDHEALNEFTYDRLRAEGDVERMRTIEAYGYPIIALNKFLLGKDPVAVIDRLLSDAFKKKRSEFDDRLTQLLQKYAPTQTKLCQRCGIERPIEAFFDERLKTNLGRICSSCNADRGLEAGQEYEIDADAQGKRGGARAARPTQAQLDEDRYYLGLPATAEEVLEAVDVAIASGIGNDWYDVERAVIRHLFGPVWLRGPQRADFDATFGTAAKRRGLRRSEVGLAAALAQYPSLDRKVETNEPSQREEQPRANHATQPTPPASAQATPPRPGPEGQGAPEPSNASAPEKSVGLRPRDILWALVILGGGYWLSHLSGSSVTPNPAQQVAIEQVTSIPSATDQAEPKAPPTARPIELSSQPAAHALKPIVQRKAIDWASFSRSGIKATPQQSPAHSSAHAVAASPLAVALIPRRAEAGANVSGCYARTITRVGDDGAVIEVTGGSAYQVSSQGLMRYESQDWSTGDKVTVCGSGASASIENPLHSSKVQATYSGSAVAAGVSCRNLTITRVADNGATVDVSSGSSYQVSNQGLMRYSAQDWSTGDQVIVCGSGSAASIANPVHSAKVQATYQGSAISQSVSCSNQTVTRVADNGATVDVSSGHSYQVSSQGLMRYAAQDWSTGDLVTVCGSGPSASIANPAHSAKVQAAYQRDVDAPRVNCSSRSITRVASDGEVVYVSGGSSYEVASQGLMRYAAQNWTTGDRVVVCISGSSASIANSSHSAKVQATLR